MNFRPLLYVSLACLGAGPTLAEEAEEAGAESRELERLTVTATALGAHAEDLPIPVGVLEGDELLLKSGSGSLGETLANEPGITGSYFGPVSSRPIIRGQSGARVRILQDRVGSLDVSDISPDHAVSVEPLFARSIEVLRGPATLLYGSGAEGGVVNTVTNRVPIYDPLSPFEGAVQVRGDTATGEEAALGMFEGRVGSWNWHLEGVTRETDDVEINGPAERPGLHADEEPGAAEEEVPDGVIPNSDSDTWSYSGGFAWTGERGHAGVAYTRYKSRYGLPGESHGHEGEEAPEEEEIFDGARIFLDQERYDFRGEWRPAEGRIEAIRLDGGVSDYTHREVEPTGETGTVFDDESHELRAELVHGIGEWNGVAGLQYFGREFSAVGEEAYLPFVETTSLGAFVLEERHFGELKFSFGGRVEQLEHDPEGTLPAYDDSALSGSVGFVYPFDPVALSANLNYTERHPAPEELYSGGPHLATGLYEIGDPDLDKEKNVSVDLGLRGETGALSWSVNVFYKDAGDYIYLANTGEIEDELPVAEYRQGDATFYGYELEARFPLAAFAGGELVGLAWSDYTRGRLDGVPGDRDIPRMPDQRFAAGLEWVALKWSAAIEAIRHMGQDDVAEFETPTDSYTLVNADFLYDLAFGRTETTLFLRGKNLLDEDGRRSVSFLKDYAPIPGRSLEAGFRVAF